MIDNKALEEQLWAVYWRSTYFGFSKDSVRVIEMSNRLHQVFFIVTDSNNLFREYNAKKDKERQIKSSAICYYDYSG